MGNCGVGALLLGCMLVGPAAVLASTEAGLAVDYETVNQNLQGKVAAIELEDGSTIKKAKKVVVEPNFTYWQANGKERKVETGQVVRIQARSKSKGLVGLGAGAAVGALASLASNEGECRPEEDAWCTSDAHGGYAIVAAGFGGLVGYGVTKAIPRQRVVVFEAPRSRNW